MKRRWSVFGVVAVLAIVAAAYSWLWWTYPPHSLERHTRQQADRVFDVVSALAVEHQGQYPLHVDAINKALGGGTISLYMGNWIPVRELPADPFEPTRRNLESYCREHGLTLYVHRSVWYRAIALWDGANPIAYRYEVYTFGKGKDEPAYFRWKQKPGFFQKSADNTSSRAGN